MLETTGGVVAALKTFRDFYNPKSTSVLGFGNGNIDIDADPFRRGFLAALETRTELLKRLASLGERERAIVTLWYVTDLPVREICERLALSRSHAYRIRDRALQVMTGSEEPGYEIVDRTA